MSERWARIEALVHDALARPATERDAFLDATCGSDTGLRREVDSLLAQATGAGTFLETPLALPSLIGRQIGPYRVDAQIGAGGMGEVYRAHDTKLGRDVAIKILPALMTQDPDRLARLGREARILASLNHPHIGAIYGIEDLPAAFDGAQAGETGSHGRALGRISSCSGSTESGSPGRSHPAGIRRLRIG